MMKAAFLTELGDPDVIQYGELPAPVPGDHQVLIRVYASSVNPIDTYVRSGLVEFELPEKFCPGCDAAGVIEAIGEKVSQFHIGDRVWCTNQGLLGRQGTLAEKIAIDETECFPLPDRVTYADAAANALVGVTAHLGLFREAKLKAGETVMVIGGTGGVGSMVVQMAKTRGCRVITTAGSRAKADHARSLGADVVIEYRQASIADAAREHAPEGVNVFWETRRDPDFELAIEMMAPRGRMVLMAGRDAKPEFPVGPFYVKECSLHGFVMFKATPEELRRCAEEINLWSREGQLRANIGKTFLLEQAAEAHRLQESATLNASDHLTGKIVVLINERGSFA